MPDHHHPLMFHLCGSPSPLFTYDELKTVARHKKVVPERRIGSRFIRIEGGKLTVAQALVKFR